MPPLGVFNSLSWVGPCVQSMSRARHYPSTVLKECVNNQNAIDFVGNVHAPTSEMAAYGGVLEGPPAFLESQGIRYVPAPLDTPATDMMVPEDPVQPMQSMSSAMSSLDLEERIQKSVKNCLKTSSAGVGLGAAYQTPRRHLQRLTDPYDTYDTKRGGQYERLNAPYAPYESQRSGQSERLNASYATPYESQRADRTERLNAPYRHAEPTRYVANSNSMRADSDDPMPRRRLATYYDTSPPAPRTRLSNSMDNVDDESHERLRQLHADIMASAPPKRSLNASARSVNTPARSSGRPMTAPARSMNAPATMGGSDDSGHRRLQQLHAEIMASDPKNVAVKSAPNLDAGWDSDDGIFQVTRQPYNSLRSNW